MSAATAEAPFLRLRGVHKHFGAVHALRGVDLEVRRGEIHALVGENGSGKTTLMRIIAGDLQADAGTIEIDGQVVGSHDPLAAKQAGIGLVYQEPNLAPDLTVAENVFMGALPTRMGRVDWKELRRRYADVEPTTGIRLDPDRRVGRLSPDQRQLVEIAKVVMAGPSFIALDEPTASLTSDEVETLFALLRRLRDQGTAVVLITHRMREITQLCDRATILRDGEFRGVLEVADVTEDEIVRQMVGRELLATHRTVATIGEPVLETRGLTRGTTLTDIDLVVRAGEIVGIAGLVGAGRSALVRTLFGLRTPDAGEVLVDGRPVTIGSPRKAIALGMGIVPEDRRQSGLCLDMSISENLALTDYASRPGGRADRGGGRRRAGGMVDAMAIRCPGVDAAVRTLSGGNQQKVVLGRWAGGDGCRVLLLDEPTRGIDVGAKAEIYMLLDRLCAEGVAVLVSSSELPELLTLSDRIYAIREGRMTGHFTREEATEEGIARAMAGLSRVP